MLQKVKTAIGKTKQLSSIQNVATKRLMKDWKECIENPLKGISASPISENNLFIWHINLKGIPETPWQMAIFHIIMNIPENYPQSPPTLTLSTKIFGHPNIIDNQTICLDILQQNVKNNADPSIIFCNINDPKTYELKKQEWLSSVQWSVDQSRNYVDKRIKHYPPYKPFPPFNEDIIEKKDVEQQQELSQEEIVMKCIRSELFCFFTKQTFEDDVLGFGIYVDKKKQLNNAPIKSISSSLDILSLRAFMNHKVRKSPTKRGTFTHWIPIFINEKHGQKAMYLAKRAISIICTDSNNNFTPEMVLQVLPKLLSATIIEVISNHTSRLKVLHGYCHIYRLFLEFIKEYPNLLELINLKIRNFIEDEKTRHKDVTPNLGEILVLIPLSSFTWKDIEKVYIEENFTRNVYWLLNKYEELEQESNDEFNDDDRLKFSFETTKISQKILMLNVFFIEKICRPLEKRDLEEIRIIFDNHLGGLPLQYEDLFITTFKKLNKIDNYFDFFKEILGENNNYTKEIIVKLLKDCIKKSKERGYHDVYIKVPSPKEHSTHYQEVNYFLFTTEGSWKYLCSKRWNIKELPDSLTNEQKPWKKLFLQRNLQNVISNLNDTLDFDIFHKVLNSSSELTRLEIQMFDPDHFESKYYFLTTALAKLPNLKALIIKRGECGLGEKGFKAVMKGLSTSCKNLEELVLSNCDLNEKSIFELKGKMASSRLKKLDLSVNSLGYLGALYLSQYLSRHHKHPNLEELNISWCKIDKSGSALIAEALLVKKNLKVLKVEGNTIDTSLQTILQNLAYSSCIREIDVSRITGTITDETNSITKLFNLTVSLKKINFWRTKCISNIQENTFFHLRYSTVKELDLAETSFTNVSRLAQPLREGSSLEEINLFNNGITCSDMYKLYEALTRLYFTNGGIDLDDFSQPPPKTISIKRLVLAKNKFSVTPTTEIKYSRVIGQFLKMTNKLVYLDLSNCGISYDHIQGIGDALSPKYNLPLKTLLLKSNDIGKTGLSPLVSSLQENTILETLDISDCKLGVIGCRYLSQIMEKNKGIKTLNLFSNFIENEGVQSLCRALENNNTLTSLDLGLNRIKQRGAESIAKLLESNNALQKIGLKFNHIKDSEGLAIANAIVENQNSSVSFVALAGNLLSYRTISQIVTLLDGVDNNSNWDLDMTTVTSNWDSIVLFVYIVFSYFYSYLSSIFKSESKQRKITFDLSKLNEWKENERLERTVVLTPISDRVKVQQIKSLFYQYDCGGIVNVSIHKHNKIKTSKTANYAFVEFSCTDSVKSALDLCKKGQSEIDGAKIKIRRAHGLSIKKKKRKTKKQ
ncbi:hypothetical protein ABK040_007384 [Willaertia magna]